MNADLIEQLAAAVAERIQTKDGLWSAHSIAAFMDYRDDSGKPNAKQILNKFAPLPSFPESIRADIVGGGRSQPRWKESEIRAWADANQSKKVTGKLRIVG